jgi:DNA-binding beta-propeller fold protein YncE
MKPLLSTLMLSCAMARGATLFLGAYPDAVIVFDESKGQIVDRIPLTTGLPTSLRLSEDKQKIYVTTNDRGGIEVIDIATRKVINHFELNTPTRRFRFMGGTPDSQGKLFLAVTIEIDKLVDRFEVGKAKYTVIDLAQQKIAKTVDIASEDESGNSSGYGIGNFEISPDDKFLYQFRDKVAILKTDDFSVVDRIELAKPDLPGMENVGFGGLLDSIAEPGHFISLFVAADPVVHNLLFGIARFDLASRQVDFTPIGPVPDGMAGLQVTPDKKTAYTVVATGAHGKKRCEFWAFDLATDRIIKTEEVPCRTRFSLGMSGDGKKLYFYGAGFQIEVYDAATLKYEKTWDLNTDITFAGMVTVP